MNAIAAIRHSALRLASVGVALAAPLSAVGAELLDQFVQRQKLTVALQYVAPEYKAGAKFRTPESIDAELAGDLAKRLGVKLETVRLQPQPVSSSSGPGDGKRADLALAVVAEPRQPQHAQQSSIVVPVGYTARPMAIMRTDTDIKSWQQLKGRKVCMSEGGLYVGTLAARYGAVEVLKRAPADSLLAIRVGECDAAVHDSLLLEELIRLPEWKKFSARLPAGVGMELAFHVPAGQEKTAARLRQVVKDWNSAKLQEQLMKKAVRHIAFEVYLDQDVPDCH